MFDVLRNVRVLDFGKFVAAPSSTWLLSNMGADVLKVEPVGGSPDREPFRISEDLDGAGFLQLNELVECCHIAENVFDILRKGERRVTAELMDVVLQALDSVNEMFSQVRERAPITAATPELLAALATASAPTDEGEAADRSPLRSAGT